jgi:Tfp pilus assembly protein PilP
MTSSLRSPRLVAALALAVGLAACGGKDDAPPAAAAQPAVARAAPKKATKAADKNALQVYTKVEDVVPEKEVATIRHAFHERDFTPDLTGTDNRDPFQSFVVSQPGIRAQGGALAPATEQCTAKQMVATSYSLRDLRLVAIISRGLRRFALFQDTADIGHLATRFDCLGKEKARVKEIGERSVVLEIVPEANQGQAPRAPEVKSIALYPNELPIGAVGPGADRTPMTGPVPGPEPTPGGPSSGAPRPPPGPMLRPMQQ